MPSSKATPTVCPFLKEDNCGHVDSGDVIRAKQQPTEELQRTEEYTKADNRLRPNLRPLRRWNEAGCEPVRACVFESRVKYFESAARWLLSVSMSEAAYQGTKLGATNLKAPRSKLPTGGTEWKLRLIMMVLVRASDHRTGPVYAATTSITHAGRGRPRCPFVGPRMTP